MFRITAVAVAGALVMGSTAAAQSVGDVAAYVALSLTPVGALPVMARATMFDAGPAPASFNARYGTQDELHTFGVGGDFRAGGSARAAVSLGYLTCDGCDGVLMLGADYITPVFRSAVGTGTTPASFTVSVNPSLGVARPTDGELSALAASVGLPAAVALGGAGARVAAFISPGLGFGLLSGAGESESGMRPMLGGGLGVRLGQVTISGSAQKIFIDGGETQYGLGIAMGR
jgi:hypothetical protein